MVMLAVPNIKVGDLIFSWQRDVTIPYRFPPLFDSSFEDKEIPFPSENFWGGIVLLDILLTIMLLVLWDAKRVNIALRS